MGVEDGRVEGGVNLYSTSGVQLPAGSHLLRGEAQCQLSGGRQDFSSALHRWDLNKRRES